MEVMYTAIATSVGGRSGNVKSSDGVLDLEVRSPQHPNQSMGSYTNPEQLFAAGYAACFGSALSHVALAQKIRIRPEVTAKISIGKNDSGEGFQLAAELDVYIPDMDQAKAEELVRQAHQVCPYSNATRNNIEVSLRTTTSETEPVSSN